MSAPFFFQRGDGLTVGEIAALVGGRAAPPTPNSTGASPASRRSSAPTRAISPSSKAPNMPSRRPLPRAGACLTIERFASHIPSARRSAGGARALSRLRRGGTRAVSGCAASVLAVRSRRDVPPGAFVHPTARLESGVTHRSGRGDRTARRDRRRHRDRRRSRHRTGVRIGRDCAIGPNVSIVHALIGDRVIIHPGCASARMGSAT